MDSNRKLAEQQYREINGDIIRLKAKRDSEIEILKEERYQPMIDAANKVLNEIHSTVKSKYQDEFTLLYQKEKEFKNAIDEFKKQGATSLWHPHGTIVTLYKKKNFSNDRVKTDLTGTVQIYDGTQEVGENISSYSLPDIGDIVVFHNRKDGSMGKRFDIISRRGELQYHPMWLAEGETPENNLELQRKSIKS